MRRLKTVRRPPIYPKTPGHLPCSSLTHPLPLPSRRPSVSFGGFGLRGDVGIDAFPENGCWILTEKTQLFVLLAHDERTGRVPVRGLWRSLRHPDRIVAGGLELPSRELWDCYQAVANHLLLVNALLEVGKDEEAAMVADEPGLTIEQPMSWNEPPEEQMESMYGRTIGRVIQIGATPAQIISVTRKYVIFVDEEEGAHSIDLEECHRNYIAWITKGLNQGDLIDLSSTAGFRVRAITQDRRVGFRGALDHPPWMSFTNEPPTMFQFRSSDELHEELLTPLMQILCKWGGVHLMQTNPTATWVGYGTSQNPFTT